VQLSGDEGDREDVVRKLGVINPLPWKFALFSVSGLKDENLIKEQTYTKTEACKLYSRVF